jgi:response regulator RpfG family c-di-GMP phosphodiesterase
MIGLAAEPAEPSWRAAELLADPGVDSVCMVRHQHEWRDGSGGPNPLRGEMIPSEAAVLAVANALDHYAATRIQTGVAPFDAVDRSIAMISTRKIRMFYPAGARTLLDRLS